MRIVVSLVVLFAAGCVLDLGALHGNHGDAGPHDGGPHADAGIADRDGDGFASNVDCNDDDANIHPGPLTLEACCASSPCTGCTCDGVDNNCNGLIDEDASCRSPDLDGDGHAACMPGVTDCASCDCNDCDSGIHPGAPSHCGNAIDEDGIGGDPACDPGDTDQDGYVGGRDCAEGDAHTHLDAAENCTTPASESCGTMSCPASVDADHDGFAAMSAGGSDCDDGDASVNAWAQEICNGVDDNCDGETDEVLDPTNTRSCVTDPTCGASARCDVDYRTNLHHCGGCRQECNPGATLVADACMNGTCACTTNGNVACSVGTTCCVVDGMGRPVAQPGCFDTSTSMAHCGGCGVVCDAGAADACVSGHCACGTGPACSTGICCGGHCVDVDNDPTHCGSCGRSCGPNGGCAEGICGCEEPTRFGDCDGDLGMPGGTGCETALDSDAVHCGACATSCLDEHVAAGLCTAGACVITSCDAMYADCNGRAADGCECVH